jgi:TBC1 domain family member 5
VTNAPLSKTVYQGTDPRTVLEADYTNALQLLLKYPAPEPPHGPHTFVDDALYLKDHYHAAGGSSIIMKYTGKTPAPILEQSPSTTEERFQGLSLRDRARGTRSPLRSPARFIQQRGVEALFQGAAKNVIERGEKLGINQAVRDAMGEIRKNMQQGLQEARNNFTDHSRSGSNTPRHDIFSNGTEGSPVEDLRNAMSELEQRNKQLALFLDEAITGLKEVSNSRLEGDKEKALESVELAAAKAQLVKVYLENPSLELPTEELREDERIPPQIVVEDDALPAPAVVEDIKPSPGNINDAASPSLMVAADEMMVDPSVPGTPKQEATMEGVEHEHSSPLSPTSQPLLRPTAVPTRSTMAQSSFTLMLEPDQSPSAASHSSSGYSPSSLPSAGTTPTQNTQINYRKPRDSVSRDRNAFLFGEVTDQSAATAAKAFTSEDIFGLEPIRRRPSKARGKYEDLFGGALADN